MASTEGAIHHPGLIGESMAPIAMRIEKRGSKWVVLPENGDHVLGTHDTREDAERQLAAIEASKARAAQAHSALKFRLGPTVAFNASPSPDEPLTVGRWDRFTTWGPKDKDGPSEFNEQTLGEMLHNWERRGMRLAMCQDHKSTAAPFVAAPAMAFYDALAVVRDGRVINFAKLAISRATTPDYAALKQQVARFATTDNPEPLPDGMWGMRCEITPLGHDPKEGLRCYRGISPLFDPNGKNEQGEPIGYYLLDVAATNTTFQAGCEITFGAMSALAPLLDCATCGQRLADVDFDGRLPVHPGRDGQPCPGSEKEPGAKGMTSMAAERGSLKSGDHIEYKDKSGQVHRGTIISKPDEGADVGAIWVVRDEDVNKDDMIGWDDVVRKMSAFSSSGPAATSTTNGAPTPKGVSTMDPTLLAKFGITDKSTPEETDGAIKKHLDGYKVKMSDEPAEKMEDHAAELLKTAGEIEKSHPEHAASYKALAGRMKHMAAFDVQPGNAAQNAAVHIKTGNSHDGKGDTKIDPKKMSADAEDEERAKGELAQSFGVQPTTINFRSLLTHIQAKTVNASDLAAAKGQIQSMSAQLVKIRDEKIADQAARYVEQQIADGRAEAKSSVALVQAFSTAAVTAHDKGLARDAVAKAGQDAIDPFLCTKGALTLGQRVTAGGHPVGKPAMPVTSFAADSPDAIEHTIADKAKALVVESKGTMSFGAAQKKVLADDHALAAQFLASRQQ